MLGVFEESMSEGRWAMERLGLSKGERARDSSYSAGPLSIQNVVRRNP
jgi:hypothetical protein